MRVLFERIQFADFLRHALISFDFGVMVFEKVFDVQEVNGKKRIVWKKLAPRLPRSILNGKSAESALVSCNKPPMAAASKSRWRS